MNPIKHIFITIIFCLVYFRFGEWNSYVIFGSIVSTTMIDIIDHSTTIFFQNQELTVKTRQYLKKGDFLRAYKLYYSDRKKYIKYMYIHNKWVLTLLLICFGVFTFINSTISIIILFGLILHFLCDILENYYYKENMEFWIGNRM